MAANGQLQAVLKLDPLPQSIKTESMDGLKRFRISLDKIEEIDSETKNVVKSITDMQRRKATWVSSNVGRFGGMVDGVVISQLDGTINIAESGQTVENLMLMTSYTFYEQGSIVWADQTFPVMRGQVKISFEIKKWDFIKPTNQLRICFLMGAVGGSHSVTERNIIKRSVAIKGQDYFAKPTTNSEIDADPRKDDNVVLLGHTVLSAANVCIIDNVASTNVVCSGYNDEQKGIQWTFPHFSSRLVFSYILDSESELAMFTNSNSRSTSSMSDESGVIMVDTVAAIIILVGFLMLSTLWNSNSHTKNTNKKGKKKTKKKE